MTICFKLCRGHIYSGFLERTNQRKRGRRVRHSKGPGCRRWHTLIGAWTHLVNTGPDASKIINRHVSVHYILCINSVYSSKLICFHAPSGPMEGHVRGRVTCQGASLSHIKTQHNDKSHRPDWLVHLVVACNTPTGQPNPTICKLLLQASSFKRESLQHGVTALQATKVMRGIHICTAHIHTFL